jgi:hypothetical protein
VIIKRTRILTIIAISGDKNVISKGIEKISEYKEFKTQIYLTSRAKTKVIPVIHVTRVTGILFKLFRQFLNNIFGSTENSYRGQCSCTLKSNDVRHVS